MRTARIIGITLLVVAVVVVTVVAYRYGGLGTALGALFASLAAGGYAGTRKRHTARQRPDLVAHIAATDAEANDDTEAAIAAAALGIEEAKRHADDVRADAGPDSPGVAGDDAFLRDELGAVEWRPPVDPSADTAPG